MARYSRKSKPSPETREEAMRIARGIQRPGQTKEQTKLIAQGIQKGIDLYKKQQKAKARELDRMLKKAPTQDTQKEEPDLPPQELPRYRQHWLPWALLVTTWFGIAAYFVAFKS